MKQNTDSSSFSLLPDAGAYDPIEDRLRANVRATIEVMFEEELADFLGRLRYGRGKERARGYRHGHRDRQLTGTFGTETVRVPRARIEDEAGKITEWRSKALPRYRRLTKKAEALIAAVYLAGTNTRRVKRALFGLFEGAVSKDVVSRAWRKVKVDWDAWSTRDLAEEDIVRLILDGTVIKTRLDRKATNISVLAAIGVRRDGQKVLLSIRNMGGESTAAWGSFLADLDARGLRRPEFVIVDGAPGLEAALVALWGEDLAIQRCTVHKHRNLLGHAPKRLHDELSEDYRDMIYADSAAGIDTRRKAFLRKWKLKCRAVADSVEEAGDRLFSFTRLDPSQWKSARTTNAIERLNEEFRRRIKTQTVLPCAETVPMLLWALLASGQIQMRKVDGWEPFLSLSCRCPLTSRPDWSQRYMPGARCSAISTTFATRPKRPVSRHFSRPTKKVNKYGPIKDIAVYTPLKYRVFQKESHIGTSVIQHFSDFRHVTPERRADA